MKMHSSKFRDPLISRAQPIVLIAPIVEETLRTAGVQPSREQIFDLFMSGQPRIAVVHGGEDHPPNIGMKETIRRVIRVVWANNALPFEVSQNVPCEALSQGSEGAQYALLSRNLCAASLSAQMETQGYDAAIVLGACDKMMVGNLRALAEVDLARQHRRAKPVFAMVIPSIVARECFLSDEDRRRFEPLRSRLSDSERRELEDLLRRPLKPNVYAQIKVILDRCFHRRILQEGEKDDLERLVAKCAAAPGASCAASEASMVHRLMLASLGLAPRRLEIALKPPPDDVLSEAVKRLLLAVQKRERRVSVAGLIRSNIGNSASVWSATGGHPSWILHLSYLADAVSKKLTVADVTRRARTVPQILGIGEPEGKSVYAMAVETENGGNSGIDTIMRTLAENRLIEDRALTLDGPWAHRIMDARSANGNFFHSTMTPYSASCGLSGGIHGNMCAGGVVRLGACGSNGIGAFDRKTYLAVYYLGVRDLLPDLAAQDGILERLKPRVSRDDLYYTWLVNWQRGEVNGSVQDIEHWNKARLWDYLIAEKLLRVMIVVAGAGPRAAGMPEVHLSSDDGERLTSMCVLATDGRVSYSYDGLAIAHLSPEAFDGGPLGSIRTGDWIHLDLSKNEVHVVNYQPRRQGCKLTPARDLLHRPELKKRLHELEKQRLTLLPSCRMLLDHVSSAESGVSPAARS